MPRLHLAFVFLGFSLTGCAIQENVTANVDDPCASLQDIVADYPEAFSDFRKGGSNFRSMTIYRTNEELIRGHCEIWAWGNGDSAYVCTSGVPNSNVADLRYKQAVTKVAGCLGQQWLPEERVRERDGEAAGMVTVFQKQDGESPSISVHRVEDRSSHSIYLYIGRPGRKI